MFYSLNFDVFKVVDSVLEHDEEQRKANSSDGSQELQPLPIPNFDAISTSEAAAIEEENGQEEEKTPQPKEKTSSWYYQMRNTWGTGNNKNVNFS